MANDRGTESNNTPSVTCIDAAEINSFPVRVKAGQRGREGGGEIPSVQIKFTEKPIIVPPLFPRLTRALGESLEFISSSEGMIRFRRSDTEREGINLYVCVFIYISFSLSLSQDDVYT